MKPRRCSAKGCKTIISIYNRHGDMCFRHAREEKIRCPVGKVSNIDGMEKRV